MQNGQIKQLKYIKFSEFEKMSEPQIYNYFSLTENFELCIAKKGSTIIHYDENDQIIATEDTGEDKVVIEKIPYKDYIENYSIPFNFLISLHVISEDKEFMEEVVKQALGAGKEETVVLTYVETTAIQTEEIQYNGRTRITKKIVDAEGNEIIKEPEEIDYEPITVYNIDNSNVKTETDVEVDKTFKKVRTSIFGSLCVTKADTWLVSSEKQLVTKEAGHEQTRTKNIYETVERPRLSPYGDIPGEYIEETIYKSLDKNTTNKYSSWKYTLLDKGFKLKVDDFVELIKKYPTAENNITSAPNNLFALLQEHENTEFFEKVMRYVLFKLNDVDYGITEDDLLALFRTQFKRVENIGTLRTYLAQFSKNYKPIYLDEEQKYYKMFGDENGNPIIGDAELSVKSYFNISGKVKHNGEEKEVENIAEYVEENVLPKGFDDTYNDIQYSEMKFFIEKELVDDIAEAEQKAMYNDLKENELFGLNLARQQLYGLVAIYNEFGYLPAVNGRTFKEVYRAGKEEYEEGSWQHNRYIWDNWWSYIPGDETHIDAQYQTYLKGVYDLAQSDAGFNPRNYYMFYTQEQLSSSNHQGALYLNTKRTAENEPETFKLEKIEGVFKWNNGRYRIGYYYSTTGRRFTIIDQSRVTPRYDVDNFEDEWSGKCNRAASVIVASGYSSENETELIQSINKGYDGADVIPSDETYWNKYGLEISKKYGALGATSCTNILREHLQNGGYALIWLNGASYTGASGRIYTGSDEDTYQIHWVCVLDYKETNRGEQMVVANAGQPFWCDIEEFIGGVARLILVSEK